MGLGFEQKEAGGEGRLMTQRTEARRGHAAFSISINLTSVCW